MTFKLGTVCACAALALAGCSGSNTAPASTGATVAAPSSGAPVKDIVAADTPVTLGTGWYSYETYQGTSFRWVDDDAKFTLHSPVGILQHVTFDVEAGPGIGHPIFTLHLRDSLGEEIAKVTAAGRERVTFAIPTKPGHDAEFELHPDGGGKSTPHDNRTLNFRVFAIDEGPGTVTGAADIVVSPSVTLGKNWGVLEQSGGRTFRWVNNDAALSVAARASGIKELTLSVESGPSIVSPRLFSIVLLNAKRKPLQTVHVPMGGLVVFDVPLIAGKNDFVLHVESTGKRASAADSRVLDFRAFMISLT